MSSLAGQVVVITGSASGIGQATARLLASQGALLSLADVNKAALEATKQELLTRYPSTSSERTLVFECDVTSQHACNAWIQATLKHFHPLRIAAAVNLAGVIGKSITQESGRIRNISDDEFNLVMLVNCNGILNCLRAELPAMRTGGSSIVNAASIAGLVGVEANGPYVASKHAVVGLTRTLAKEEGPNGIRCNAIAPGIIATPMMTQIEQSKGSAELFAGGDPGALARKGTADEVAQVIAFLASDASSFINGAVVPVDGGWIC